VFVKPETGLLDAGVTIVSDKLLGLRFGGLSGFVNEASLRFKVVGNSRCCVFDSVGTDVAAPRGTFVLPVVLTARFFKFFFGRLAASEDRLLSKKPPGRPFSGGLGLDPVMFMRVSIVFVSIVDAARLSVEGDSGEDPGEVSVMLESSGSESVVVGDGDELDEYEEEVELLPSGLYVFSVEYLPNSCGGDRTMLFGSSVICISPSLCRICSPATLGSGPRNRKLCSDIESSILRCDFAMVAYDPKIHFMSIPSDPKVMIDVLLTFKCNMPFRQADMTFPGIQNSFCPGGHVSGDHFQISARLINALVS